MRTYDDSGRAESNRSAWVELKHRVEATAVLTGLELQIPMALYSVPNSVWGSDVNIDVKSIHSLTEFKRNASELVGRAKATRRPLVLTVNGRAEAVVLGADVYQEMVDRLEDARTVEAVERMDRGEGRPARAALARIRRKHAGGKV